MGVDIRLLCGIIKETKGNKMSKKIEFRTGEIVSFRYRQPVRTSTERRMGKVLSIRNVTKYPVHNSYYRWFDKDFRRSGNLFTVKHSDSSVQVYYENRCFGAKRPNLLQRMWFRIVSNWPQYFPAMCCILAFTAGLIVVNTLCS
jgi:hypothetical protein